MPDETLDPVAIAALPWISTRQACVYLNMGPNEFRAFSLRHRIPYQAACEKPNAKKRFKRTLLDAAMDRELGEYAEGDGAGPVSTRVQQILGETR